MRRARQGGSSVLEFALIAMPLFLMTIGMFEVGRGLWMYHTLASSVKAGARFAVVHGEDCVRASATCAATVTDAVNAVRDSGAGIQPQDLSLMFTAGSNTVQCAPATACAANTAQWPPASANAAGQSITVGGTYAFRSVLTVFWPGHAKASMVLTAQATESIQF